MKNIIKNQKLVQNKNRVINILAALFIFSAIIASCKKDDDTNTNTNTSSGYQQVNLVSDLSTYSGARVDPNLANAWGIAIANTEGADYIYAANFKGNTIDVFDGNFNYFPASATTFKDPALPAGYAPFNIYNHDGKLYVAYAKQLAPDNEDDEKGVGNGYIDIFDPNGTLEKRFASNGSLNSPWAIVDAPSGFGLGDDVILIGNFGDGKINVFGSDGSSRGQLMENGNVIAIDGLWALAFPENGIPAGDQNQLFFTAGPQDEAHGLFGYLKHK